MCGKPVPKGRRTWCGDQCVEDYLVRANAAHARMRVQERDKGVCESCGLDVYRVAKSINRRARSLGSQEKARALVSRLPGRMIRVWTNNPNWESRWPRSWPGVDGDSLWQADHRVPVAEGGGSCGLENLRTLCIWCHKRETAELARRLAAKRNPQQQLFQEDRR